MQKYTYEVSLNKMGNTEDGGQSISEDSWIDDNFVWNVWAVMYISNDSEIYEVVDIDIPKEYPLLAEAIYKTVSLNLDVCEASNIKVT